MLALSVQAILLTATAYIVGATYWYAAPLITLTWWRLYRTGRIAGAENKAVKEGLGNDVCMIYWLPVVLIALFCICAFGANAISIATTSGIAFMLTVIGLGLHQYIHNAFINYNYLSPQKWYDVSGKKFLDARRLSEISGGLVVSGWFNCLLMYLLRI